jgi:hypothetical protein
MKIFKNEILSLWYKLFDSSEHFLYFVKYLYLERFSMNTLEECITYISLIIYMLLNIHLELLSVNVCSCLNVQFILL